ncbi:efflux RND transporter permease subunit [Chitinispirillales bacterium ANBcel5]|uniref:efflux RND transporter permease subunit n=1 Tax=Cellulosispirillum alkaliphilum TaxID=3039283 RepID=UPI002A55472C|nr:efflux RND transporter permease subunit [Chitinispirillales bacterium ANBcel5]
MNNNINKPMSLLDKLIRFCLENKVVTFLLAIVILGVGIAVAPFNWDLDIIPRSPVAVDAIPDIGENQQIVFTEWEGRSPQDVEDQITYPLTVSLLGIPQVRSVRSFSMPGFSMVYVIFDEEAEFYWSRSRILEKLSSLPAGTLPQGVSPALGPDATALGQVFWYTLEGRDKDGNETGGWDLQELRSIQDWQVRYSLAATEGVSEVASIGGFVKEYQIDVDPAAMNAHGITINQVYDAVRNSNTEVGARTVEINQVEYMVRGLGFVKSVGDLEQAVVTVRNDVPIMIKDVAKVTLGPALRSGVLDKEGVEAVGGVVVARYGENPLEVIQSVKEQIETISPGLPNKTLEDGTESQVTIVPFYDRTDLINETLGTLSEAIYLQILITILVVIVMINHLGSSILISGILPFAVLMSFLGMKYFGVDANIVSLSGIAISIGTIVDMGVILMENMLKHLNNAKDGERRIDIIFRAASEVGGAILTAVTTTIISFLPVFTMTAAEGKLFRPLAFTKTFALIASIIVALTLLPALAHLVLRQRGKISSKSVRIATASILTLTGLYLTFAVAWWAGVIVVSFAVKMFLEIFASKRVQKWLPWAVNAVFVVVIGTLLTFEWLPLGSQRSTFINLLFVAAAAGSVLFLFRLFEKKYATILSYFLKRKVVFLVPVGFFIIMALSIWLGFSKVFFFLPGFVKQSAPVVSLAHTFPGLGREFMPPLDEGSFLYMPTIMAHGSQGAAQDIMRIQNMAIRQIPEVESVVGKIGRAESPLDPAPVSMFETVINIKPEFSTDESGRRINYRYNRRESEFVRDASGNLIEDPRGRPYRQWRPEIESMDDIWDEISMAASVPGVTGAPLLQPIAARVVMLQSGMRAPMGIKVMGPDIESIETFSLQLEELLKEVPSVNPAAVLADRIVGKPYLEFDIDRGEIARYGLSVAEVQNLIEVAIGGRTITTTVEGRERYGVRVRYPRELRADPETMGSVLVPTPSGAQIPLNQLGEFIYRRGPDMIRAEETFLTSYVLFDSRPGYAEVNVVEAAREYLQSKIDEGSLVVPDGVSYHFAGNYENQVRSERTLMVILPLALILIFMVLYLQFRRISTTSLIFLGIIVAWSGGFILIWLYGQSWFMDISLLGVNIRELFNMHTINLSVAIWVGFLALFGIATDDGVVMCTYLDQQFSDRSTKSIDEIRKLTVNGALKRVRPALTTSATTILALLPVLTSTGRGSDIMVPMAIPAFGGMIMALTTIFLSPVLYCLFREVEFKRKNNPISQNVG